MDLHLTSGTSNGPIPTNQVICARSTANILNDPSKAVASVVRPSKSALSQMRLLPASTAPNISGFGLTHSGAAPSFRSPLKSGLFTGKADTTASLQLRLQQHHQQQQQQQLLAQQQQQLVQQAASQQVFLQHQALSHPSTQQQQQQQQAAVQISEDAGSGIRTLLTGQSICVPVSKLVDLKLQQQRDEGLVSSQSNTASVLQNYLRNHKQLQQQQQQSAQQQQQSSQQLLQTHHQQQQHHQQQLLQQQLLQQQLQQQRRAKQMERVEQQQSQGRFVTMQNRFFDAPDAELKRQRKQFAQQQQMSQPVPSREHTLQQSQPRQNHQVRHQQERLLLQQQQQQQQFHQQLIEQQQQQLRRREREAVQGGAHLLDLVPSVSPERMSTHHQRSSQPAPRQPQTQHQSSRTSVSPESLRRQQHQHPQSQQPQQHPPSQQYQQPNQQLQQHPQRSSQPQLQQQLSLPQPSRSSLFSFPPSLDSSSSKGNEASFTGCYPNRSLLKRPSWTASPAPPPALVPAPASRQTKKPAEASEQVVEAPLVSSSLKRKATASPDELDPDPSPETSAPQAKFNLRFRNMNNLPKYAQKHKHTLHKRMGKHYGCCVDPLQSLDLVRIALQRYINKEVDELLQRYRTDYFERAIANIRENCGEEAISEDHVTNLFRAILENAKEQYAPSCSLAPQRPVSSLALLGSLPQSSAPASDTTSECGSHLSEPPGHSPARKRRTTSPFSSYKARRADDSDGDLSPVSGSAVTAAGTAGVRRRKRGGGRGGIGRGGSGRNGERAVTPTRYPVSRRCINFDVAKLTSQTKFVLGSNANVWLGLGQARGRIYSKHSDLFRYDCESKEEKQWLIDVGHMTSHGVKAKLMLHDEVVRLGSSPDYRRLAGSEVALVDFHLPEWFLRRMTDNLLLQQQQQLARPTFPKRGRRGRGRGSGAAHQQHVVAPSGHLGFLPPSPPSRPASTPANSVDFESEDFGASPSPEDSLVECEPSRTEDEDDDEDDDDDDDEEEEDDVLRSSRGAFGLSGRFEPSLPVSPGPPVLERYDDDVEDEDDDDGGGSSPLLEPPMTAGFDVPGAK